MHLLWQDLRFGARLLWKEPGFSAVALVALALALVGWFQRNGAQVGPLPNFSSQAVLHVVVGSGGISR